MVSTSWFLHALSRGSQYQAPTHRRDRTSQMLWAIPCVAPSRAHGCALDVCAEDGVHQRHRHLHVDVAALPHEQRVRPHLQGSSAQLSARSAGSGHSMQKLHTNVRSSVVGRQKVVIATAKRCPDENFGGRWTACAFFWAPVRATEPVRTLCRGAPGCRAGCCRPARSGCRSAPRRPAAWSPRSRCLHGGVRVTLAHKGSAQTEDFDHD